MSRREVGHGSEPQQEVSCERVIISGSFRVRGVSAGEQASRGYDAANATKQRKEVR